jgi:hypothetical protein
MDRSELARQLALTWRPSEVACAQCGTRFMKSGPRSLYCSAVCGRRAVYERHAEEIKAKRRERYRIRRAGTPKETTP